MVRYNRQWLECVDKSRTLELLKEGVQLRDLGSPIDVEKVTVDGLAGYMTKATGYMAKGHGKSDTSLKDEVSQVMKGRHVFGTWGDLRGNKIRENQRIKLINRIILPSFLWVEKEGILQRCDI